MDASKINTLNALHATMSEEQRQLFSVATSTEAASLSVTPQIKALEAKKSPKEGQGSRVIPSTPLFNPLSHVDEEKTEQVKDVASFSGEQSESKTTSSSSTDSEDLEDSPTFIPDVPILQVDPTEEKRQLRKRPLPASSDQGSLKKLKRPSRELPKPKLSSTAPLPKTVSTSTTSISLKPYKFPRPYIGDEPLAVAEGKFKTRAVLDPVIIIEQELLQFAETLDLSGAIDLLRQLEWLHLETEPFAYEVDQIRAFYENLAIAPALQSPTNPDINLNEDCCIL